MNRAPVFNALKCSLHVALRTSRAASASADTAQIPRGLKTSRPKPEPCSYSDASNTFPSMLRRSKLLQLGNPEGKVLIGTVIRVVEDDLYIDFGGKFPCVCKRPQRDANLFRRNTKVKIRLHDLELSARFLGSDRDLTLLEADATLLGLLNRQPSDVEANAKPHPSPESATET